jgi:hypothetical protein
MSSYYHVPRDLLLTMNENDIYYQDPISNPTVPLAKKKEELYNYLDIGSNQCYLDQYQPTQNRDVMWDMNDPGFTNYQFVAPPTPQPQYYQPQPSYQQQYAQQQYQQPQQQYHQPQYHQQQQPPLYQPRPQSSHHQQPPRYVQVPKEEIKIEAILDEERSKKNKKKLKKNKPVVVKNEKKEIDKKTLWYVIVFLLVILFMMLVKILYDNKIIIFKK